MTHREHGRSVASQVLVAQQHVCVTEGAAPLPPCPRSRRRWRPVSSLGTTDMGPGSSLLWARAVPCWVCRSSPAPTHRCWWHFLPPPRDSPNCLQTFARVPEGGTDPGCSAPGAVPQLAK